MWGCPRCGARLAEDARACIACGAVVEPASATHAGPEPLPGDGSPIGSRIGGYLVEDEIARGGMGVVYRARDEALNRQVALKVIAPALAADRVFRERFRRESRLAARMEHPAIVPVYRAGQDGGRLYIAMRLVDGRDLGSTLRERGALPARAAVDVIGHVGAALDAAHARGLVHRDVKPGNVLLAREGGGVFLTDFGLTIETDAATSLTRTDHWVGTVAYAAPEQLRGARADARTDVYALAGVLHHCLTGQLPYPAARDVDVISAHLVDPPPRPSTVDPGLPRALDAVVARGMQKEPARRYPSAGDLAAAARAAIDGPAAPRREQSVATGAAAPAGTSARRHRVRRRTAFAALGAVMVVLVTVVLLVTRDRDPAGEAPAPDSARALPVDGPPDHIVVAGGAIWTMATAGGRLVRTDPHGTGSEGRPAPTDLGGGEFPALAAERTALWQLQGAEVGGGVTKIDAAEGTARGRVALGGGTAAFADAGSVWVTLRRSRRGRLSRIDADTLRVTASAPAGANPVAVALAGDSLWVADRGGDQVLRFDPDSLEPRARVPVGDGPAVLAGGPDVLWVGNLGERSLSRVDPATAEVTGAPVTLGKEIEAIARSPHTLWVAAADSTVTPLDPQTGEIRGASRAVGGPPLALAADGEGVWVASGADQTIQRLDP